MRLPNQSNCFKKQKEKFKNITNLKIIQPFFQEFWEFCGKDWIYHQRWILATLWCNWYDVGDTHRTQEQRL